MVVLERAPGPAAAASFELDGIRVDHGSHRLHPAIEPRILADLRLLGDGSSAGPATAASTWRGAGSGSRCARPTWPAGCRRRSRPGRPPTPPPPGPAAPGRHLRRDPPGRARADHVPSASTSRTPASCGASTRASWPASRPAAGCRPAPRPGCWPVARAARGEPGSGTRARLRDHLRAPGRRGRRGRGRAALPGRGRAGRARPRGATVTLAGGEAGRPAGLVDRAPAHPGQMTDPAPPRRSWRPPASSASGHGAGLPGPGRWPLQRLRRPLPARPGTR